MEIYDDTYEKLSFKIKEKETTLNKRTAPADDDAALDMFGESFDEKAASATDKGRRRVKSVLQIFSQLSKMYACMGICMLSSGSFLHNNFD